MGRILESLHIGLLLSSNVFLLHATTCRSQSYDSRHGQVSKTDVFVAVNIQIKLTTSIFMHAQKRIPNHPMDERRLKIDLLKEDQLHFMYIEIPRYTFTTRIPLETEWTVRSHLQVQVPSADDFFRLAYT